eukprot:Polyplicarium_translucidae@DN2878_c0_g1_i13.p4
MFADFVRVDRFETPSSKDVPPFFFLTNCHADHLRGMTNDWCHPIHMSENTARIFAIRFPRVSTHVVVIQIGTSRRFYVDRDGDLWFDVIALDANHCAGAVMFFFRSALFGDILHTGTGPNYSVRCPQAISAFPKLWRKK